MDWLEYVKGELINKGWSKPRVRASEGLIAAAISIYNSYDGQFDAIVAAEAILRKAKHERNTAQGHNFHADETLRKADRMFEASKKAEEKAAEFYQAAEREKEYTEQERERLKGLIKALETYETEEARDRVRLAILFDKMRGRIISKDDPLYVVLIGAILAGYFSQDVFETTEESEA